MCRNRAPCHCSALPACFWLPDGEKGRQLAPDGRLASRRKPGRRDGGRALGNAHIASPHAAVAATPATSAGSNATSGEVPQRSKAARLSRSVGARRVCATAAAGGGRTARGLARRLAAQGTRDAFLVTGGARALPAGRSLTIQTTTASGDEQYQRRSSSSAMQRLPYNGT